LILFSPKKQWRKQILNLTRPNNLPQKYKTTPLDFIFSLMMTAIKQERQFLADLSSYRSISDVVALI
jgi:hypothetical protein